MQERMAAIGKTWNPTLNCRQDRTRSAARVLPFRYQQRTVFRFGSV